MKTLNMKRKQGFTIIELMIVLVIIALLMALAYPSYVDYVRKGKRGEAQQLLMNWAVNQEIWRANHPTYAPISDDPTVGISAPTADYYTFSIVLAEGTEATAYELRAAATGDQVNDEAKDGSAHCGKDPDFLTINQSGQKTPAACWE